MTGKLNWSTSVHLAQVVADKYESGTKRNYKDKKYRSPFCRCASCCQELVRRCRSSIDPSSQKKARQTEVQKSNSPRCLKKQKNRLSFRKKTNDLPSWLCVTIDYSLSVSSLSGSQAIQENVPFELVTNLRLSFMPHRLHRFLSCTISLWTSGSPCGGFPSAPSGCWAP